MTTSMIGKTLRGYELTDHIGSGGFGAVYRAQQQVIGREVAIKVILPEFANSPAFVRRFDTEAKFVAKLEHPHIVPLFDYWRDPAGAYLVMRYVSGGSLTTILKERSMTLAEIARFLDEITAALSIAHRSGVVHLDLKPDNILLDEDGNTYLTDFGIAKTVGDRPDKEAEGRISGTLAYTSPEQLQSKPPTQQSDIYSLGIILYEMLTGQHPFESKSATGMIYAHLTEDIPHLDETRPDLPLLYDDIVQKATEKDPADRYQDVREIALAFRSAIENQNANITAEMLVSLDAAQNPYMGLRPFEETDADNFFGRQEAIDELIGRMQGANFLAVVGPSGSGKSSLVKAGLLPALKRGEVDDSADWFYINMVPGTAPIENLAQALTSIATRSLSRVTGILRAHPESLHEIVTDMLQDQAGDVLLTIDQFEEVFTQVDSEDERLQFLEAIRYAVTRPQPRIRVIVTLRADFYDRPLHYEGFGSLIQQNTQVVLPLSTAELEQAIVGPADRIGVYPDADLIARMIADVREEPGALPLLQYALTEVFERREGARLTLEAYQDTGGVSGALARRAEEIFQGLSDEKQRITRQIFLRMVTLGEGEEDTRRRVRYSGLLTLGDNEQVQAVLDEYGKYRLLTFDNDPDTREPLVEVAHEALIREWQRLRDWLYTSRGDVRQQRALNQGAADWNTNHREVSFLLRGARLDQAEEWAASTDLVLTGLEREFLDASIAERTRLQQIEQERIKREQALEEQARQRLRYLVGVLTLAAAVSIGLMLLAFNRSQAESVARATSEFNASVANTQVAIAATAEQVAVDERQIAQQQADLAATAEQVALDERQIAEEQAVRAQSLALSSAAQLALLDSNLDAAAALALQANSIENAPQQAQLVLAQIAYSPGTRQLFQFDGTVDTVDINGSGTRAVTASRDDSLTLWNTETGEALQQFEGHTDRVTSVAITPDGTRIVSGSRDETAIVWNTDTGARVATLAGHTDNILAVTINDTGSLVVTGSSDGTARLWRVRTGESTLTFEGHDGPVHAVAISPIVNRVLTGGSDGVARLWSSISGQQLTQYSGHNGRINAVAFRDDNRMLLTASEDGLVRIHRPNFNDQIAEFVHAEDVEDATFSGRNDIVFSASSDGVFRAWSITTGEVVTRFTEHNDSLRSIASNATGRLAITGASDDTARVWVVDASAPERNLDIRTGDAPSLYMSEDGRRWIYGGLERGASLYAATGTYDQQLRVLGSPFNDVIAVRFSDDGEQVAAGLADRTAITWNASTGTQRTTFTGGHTAEITSVVFKPDGETLITGSLDSTVVAWDTTTGEQLVRFEGGHEDGVLSLNVSPDGNFIISGSNDGSVVIWDLQTGSERLRILGNRDTAYDIEYAPDGETIFVALGNGMVGQWSATTGRAIQSLSGHREAVRAIDLSADGSLMVSGSEDGTIILWDVDSFTQINRFVVGDPVVDVQLHPTEPILLAATASGRVDVWQSLPLTGLPAWVAENRYIPPIDCDDTVFAITPQCSPQSIEAEDAGT